MINWLKGRLSPIKRTTDRWTQFAQAIEQYWEENFDPELKRVADLRSIYTADNDGQKRIVAELGEYYESDLPDNNIPISIAQRKLEVLQKNTEVPLIATLRRLGIAAEWKPLYASKGAAYGTEFYMDHDLDSSWSTDRDLISLDGSWSVSTYSPQRLSIGVYLTSRGKLKINLTDINNYSALDVFRDRIGGIKPLHIVFDGFYYYLSLEFVLYIKTIAELTRTKYCNIHYPWCSLRLDGTWGIGVDAQLFNLGSGRQLDGSWFIGEKTNGYSEAEIRQCNIFATILTTKELNRPAAYIYPRIGEALLSLNGAWGVGLNKILVLSDAKIKKEITICLSPKVEHQFVMTGEIDYPVSPTKLSTFIHLCPWRRLDGSWRLGVSMAEKPLNGWTIRSDAGITSSMSSATKKSFSMGFYRRLGRAEVRLGASWGRLLDGKWFVGAYHDLDGEWSVGDGTRLGAPTIGSHYAHVDGTWRLRTTRSFTRDWRVGDSHPECSMEIIINK